MRQTLTDLARMARREAFLRLVGLTPTLKRRTVARMKDGQRPLALRWLP